MKKNPSLFENHFPGWLQTQTSTQVHQSSGQKLSVRKIGLDANPQCHAVLEND